MHQAQLSISTREAVCKVSVQLNKSRKRLRRDHKFDIRRMGKRDFGDSVTHLNGIDQQPYTATFLASLHPCIAPVDTTYISPDSSLSLSLV